MGSYWVMVVAGLRNPAELAMSWELGESHINKHY